MVFQFKVTIKRGAYLGRKKVERVLEVPGAKTLEDLCIAILDAVDFDFDHLYEFSIGGRIYEGQPYGGKSCRNKLYSLKLKKGETFELLYDFGDNWVFSIKVNEIREETGAGIRVLSRKGKIDQYPYEDDLRGEEVEEDEDFTDEDWPDEMAGSDDHSPFAPNAFEPDIPEPDELYDYTPPDALYEAAFRLKKTKVWKKISGDEPFMIRFTDQTTGLVSIMGQAGEHCAVAVYFGADGFFSYYSISTEEPNPVWYLEHERSFSQNCIQIIFDNQDYLMTHELESARAYARKHGIRFSGANAFPHFLRFSPSLIPWSLQNEQEEQYLCQAAEAVIALSERLKKNRPADLGFQRISPFCRKVPLMTCEDGKWDLTGMTPLPPMETPAPVTPNPDPDKMARIKKIRAKGIMQARAAMFTAPICDQDSLPPYYPYVLLALREDPVTVIPPEIVHDLAGGADQIADALLTNLLEMKWKPSKIMVEDKRTLAFLSPIAEGIGAKLIQAPALEPLDQILDNLLSVTSGRNPEDEYEDDDFDDTDYDEDYYDDDEDEEYGYDQMIDMLNAILTMPDSAIRTMPPDLRTHIQLLLDAGLLPKDLARKIKKKLKL